MGRDQDLTQAQRLERLNQLKRLKQLARLPRSFYERDTVTVARALLGQRLVRVINDPSGQVVRLSGVIVEVEAYLGIRDKAAHTYGGRRTARNETMWGEAGYAYVYFTYGMHHCVNLVTRGDGQPEAVLVRALEPSGKDSGMDEAGRNEMMRRRSGKLKKSGKLMKEQQWCSGPGKLCEAMGIDRGLDGADVVNGEQLFVERVRQRALSVDRIGVGPRMGIGYAEEWIEKPLRFWVKGNEHVSRGR